MGFAAAAIIGAVGSIASGVKQSKIAKEQNKAAKRAANARNIRERQKAFREQQIRRAQVQNVAAQTGVGGSSAVQGALASGQTQLASNIAFQEKMAGFERARFKRQERLQSAQNLAQTSQLVSQLGSTAFTTFGSKGTAKEGNT
jgi:hypothetical protein